MVRNEDVTATAYKKNAMKVVLFSATFPEQIQLRVQNVLERLNGREVPPLRLSSSDDITFTTTST